MLSRMEVSDILNELKKKFNIYEGKEGEPKVDFASEAYSIHAGRLLSWFRKCHIDPTYETIMQIAEGLEKVPGNPVRMVDALIVEIKGLSEGQPVASSPDRHEMDFGGGCDLCRAGIVMLPTVSGEKKVATCDCLSGRTRAQHIGTGTHGKPVISLTDRLDLKDLAIRMKNEEDARLESVACRFGIDIFADADIQMRQWQQRFKSVKACGDLFQKVEPPKHLDEREMALAAYHNGDERGWE